MKHISIFYTKYMYIPYKKVYGYFNEMYVLI